MLHKEPIENVSIRMISVLNVKGAIVLYIKNFVSFNDGVNRNSCINKSI